MTLKRLLPFSFGMGQVGLSEALEQRVCLVAWKITWKFFLYLVENTSLISDWLTCGGCIHMYELGQVYINFIYETWKRPEYLYCFLKTFCE